MKARLAKLDRDVQFLRLELDKLKSKKDHTPDEKEKINELEKEIFFPLPIRFLFGL